MVGKIVTFILTFTGVVFLLTTTASAYFDPSTVAMLTQIIAGVFITLGVVFGVFRRKIMVFFKNISINRTKKKIEKEAVKQNRQKNDENFIENDKE